MNVRLKVAALAACATLYAAAGLAADKVRIVNEGGIRDEWTAAEGAKFAAPAYPAEFNGRGDNVCVAMGYSIKPDGTTSDFSVVKAWSSSGGEKEPVSGYWEAFSQSSAQALSQWKFKPRPEIATPQPTYTVATMMFGGKEPMDAATLRGHCAVADLRTAVQEAKSNKFMSGKDKHELDSMRRQMNAQQQAAAAAAGSRGSSR